MPSLSLWALLMCLLTFTSSSLASSHEKAPLTTSEVESTGDGEDSRGEDDDELLETTEERFDKDMSSMLARANRYHMTPREYWLTHKGDPPPEAIAAAAKRHKESGEDLHTAVKRKAKEPKTENGTMLSTHVLVAVILAALSSPDAVALQSVTVQDEIRSLRNRSETENKPITAYLNPVEAVVRRRPKRSFSTGGVTAPYGEATARISEIVARAKELNMTVAEYWLKHDGNYSEARLTDADPQRKRAKRRARVISAPF
ncbi:hypothetical protein FOZ61_007740 [Perkinsus olseni]|uniref:RxLR effector protein n=1 Tax=Perkinsus olseni TaxID=32597 RepID=A0A7J6L7N9_PEROL|nr:hypothetical protein FOZ61_007740 [Perkinsus olseni]KAF4662873.1 hypothetical protein FOL46_005096 [Perkinsus olseni]